MGLLDSVIGAAINQAQGGKAGDAAAGRGGMGDLLGSLGGLAGMAGMQGGGQPGAAGGLGSLTGLLGEGGLGALVQKFQQAGLGQVVASWIGRGQNLPISGDQLKNVLGSDAVRGMAQQVGINPDELMGQLSQILPGLVDQLTPEGQLPQGGQLSAAGLDNLAGMLGGLTKR